MIETLKYRRPLQTAIVLALLLPYMAPARAQSMPPSTPERSPQTAVIDSRDLPDAPHPRGLGYQSNADEPSSENLSLKRTPQRVLGDERQILTSPARIGRRDLRWLVPLGTVAGVAIATDSTAMRNVVSTNATFNHSNDSTSGVLRDVLIGAPVLLFSVGELRKQEQSRDTGLLAGEAMIDAYVTSEAIKYVTLRERPKQNNAQGSFFSGNAASDPSFVSGHSIVAWSSAAVLAGEYTKPWQQIGIYAGASAVSVTRVLAQQHFPSDVLLGSVAGWLIGHYVFQVHTRGPKATASSAASRRLRSVN